MDDLLIHFGYPLIVMVLLASGCGLPLPEDIPLLATGYLCSLNQERGDLWVMLPIVFASVLGADCFLYLLGRRYGHHVPRLPLLRRYLSETRLARAERAFHEHGGKTLFTARFVPGLRAPCFFTAGVFKIPFWKMLVFDGAAALISVPAIVLIGYFFAGHLESAAEWMRDAKLAAAVVIVGVVALVAYRRYRRRRLASSSG